MSVWNSISECNEKYNWLSFTESCKNAHNYCDFWYKRGHCDSSPGFMNLYCKKACGRCTAGNGRNIICSAYFFPRLFISVKFLHLCFSQTLMSARTWDNIAISGRPRDTAPWTRCPTCRGTVAELASSVNQTKVYIYIYIYIYFHCIVLFCFFFFSSVSIYWWFFPWY
jgi:hypothetical protein